MSAAGLELVTVPALEPEQAGPIAMELARMDPWLRLGYPVEILARSLSAAHPDLTRYLALQDGQAQGVAVVRYPWLRGAYIELFAVLGGARGQGIGRALLARIESDQRARCANLWLLVSAFNGGARGFYARHGFVPIGAIPDLVAAGEDEILMRKVLVRPA